MDLKRNGRRSAIVGAGAATVTAAALILGPGTAVGAPADSAGDAMQAMQDAVDQARQAADDAAQAAEEAARAAEDVAEQAMRAAEDGGSAAGNEEIDINPDQVDWLSQDLQEDLQNLQDLPADERAEEVEQIFRDAVTGDYGREVERWAERMADFTDALPEDLRSDLQNVVGMPQDEAQEELQQIWQDVMSGGYGDDVQMWGTWLRQSFQQWNLGDVIQGDVTMESSDDN